MTKTDQSRAVVFRTPAALVSAALLVAFASASVSAAPVGTVTHSAGTVSVKRLDGTVKLLGVRSDVHEGDVISTESGTYTRVKFKDGGSLTVRPNSQVQVANYSFREDKPESDNVVISLFKGGLRAITGLLGQRNRGKVKYKAPTATIGIRGTSFGLLYCQNDCGDMPTLSGEPPANGLHIDVVDGQVMANNAGGSVDVSVGEFAFVGDMNAPPRLVPPAEGVRITLPPVFENEGVGGRGRGVIGDGKPECSIQ